MGKRTAVRFLVVAAVMATVSPSLQAQAVSPAAVAQREAIGPRRAATVAGIQTASALEVLPAPQVQRSRTGRDAALTIIGAAAFIGGLMIGDDAGTAIAVGGLAVGLFGLWNWLR